MSNFSQFFGGGGGFDMSTHSVGGGLKPSIILFDTRSGTRTFTVPEGVTKIRAFVVGGGGADLGGGGGYSEKEYIVSGGDTFNYTVGAQGTNGGAGGTSSFNSEITATGGTNRSPSIGAGGSGSGGDINTSGGSTDENVAQGGASSGHRYGNGIDNDDPSGDGGSGWQGINTADIEAGGSGGIDGFNIGLIPGSVRQKSTEVANGELSNFQSYGCGGTESRAGGIGGAGGKFAAGGIGGGGGGLSEEGGFGVVGVEVLETE